MIVLEVFSILIILIAVMTFCVRTYLIDGFVLFKKNIRMVVTLGIVVCVLVLLRHQILIMLDSFYHPWADHRGNFSLFSDFRSELPLCSHLDMTIYNFIMKIVLGFAILCCKAIVISKSFMLMTQKEYSFKAMWEQIKFSIAKMKKTWIFACVIVIAPFYLGEILVPNILWRVLFGSFSLGLLLESIIIWLWIASEFVTCAMALIASVIVSYLVCHMLNGHDKVIRKSLLMIKKTFWKLVAILIVVFGIFALANSALNVLSFFVPMIRGPAEILAWRVFDVFTVALLLFHVTTNISLFAKHEIPNMNILRQSRKDADDGKLTEHELIEE